MSKEENAQSEVLFAQFWLVYPRKRAKIHAQKVWRKLDPNEDDTAAILKGIMRYVRSGEWEYERYVPYPATFLSQRRWEDEIPSNGTRPQFSDRTRQRQQANAQAIERFFGSTETVAASPGRALPTGNH